MIRYRQDGKWWFRVRVHTIGNDDEISPWEPLESVEITDALACSRVELGPVYVTHKDEDGFFPEWLQAVNNKGMVVTDESSPSWGPDEYRLLTPDELRAAGLWND